MNEDEVIGAAKEQLHRLSSLSEQELLVLLIMELRHTNSMLRKRWS